MWGGRYRSPWVSYFLLFNTIVLFSLFVHYCICMFNCMFVWFYAFSCYLVEKNFTNLNWKICVKLVWNLYLEHGFWAKEHTTCEILSLFTWLHYLTIIILFLCVYFSMIVIYILFHPICPIFIIFICLHMIEAINYLAHLSKLSLPFQLPLLATLSL